MKKIRICSVCRLKSILRVRHIIPMVQLHSDAPVIKTYNQRENGIKTETVLHRQGAHATPLCLCFICRGSAE